VKTRISERIKITMATEHEVRDWLAEAATAFDAGDYARAAAAAQIDVGVQLREVASQLSSINVQLQVGVS
jgi:hypothetical protein